MRRTAELAQIRKDTSAVLCLDCGKCTAVCPLAGPDGFSARRIAMHVVDSSAADRDLDRCLTCGACEDRCPQGVRFVDFVREARGVCPSGSPCPHGEVFQCMARRAQDDPPRRKFEWVGDDLRIAESGSVGLFVGCLPLFDAYFADSLGLRTIEIARSAIRILNKLGIEPVLVAEERCCGHDLLWGGDRETFTELARANTEAFAARGVKHLLTTCAECCRTWRVDYPEAIEHGVPRVEHMAEFLAGRAGELGLKPNGVQSVTYHDPCRLSRHLDVVDAPRETLAALPGADVIEMERSGSDAVCCGTSGFIHCDAQSRRMQSGRLAEAAATGADKLVTACPKCLIHFRCAQTEDRRRTGQPTEIDVEDLTVLTASLMHETETAALAAAETGGAL